MSRIGDSARKVWGKLNAKLRELERRNHRIEDVGARLAELARLGEDEVPHAWLQRLLEPAAMCGDAQVRPGGEKARKLLGVRGTPTGVTAKVEIDGAALAFEDLRLVQNDNNLV